MSTVRLGLYDADRRLVEQRGPLELDADSVPLDPPLIIPAGSMVLLAIEGREGALAYHGPMTVTQVKPLLELPRVLRPRT